MKPSDVLLCVFSYNMGVTLDNCLRYIEELAPGFDVVLMDDASSDPVMRQLCLADSSASISSSSFPAI